MSKWLLHDIFHIGPGISPRLPYQVWRQSWRANMGRGLIPWTIWTISCLNLFTHILYIDFFQAFTFIWQKRSLNWQSAKINPQESCLCSACKYCCFEFCTMTLESVCKIYTRRWHLNGNSYSRRRMHLT
jgi:hypothetical protein